MIISSKYDKINGSIRLLHVFNAWVYKMPLKKHTHTHTNLAISNLLDMYVVAFECVFFVLRSFCFIMANHHSAAIIAIHWSICIIAHISSVRRFAVQFVQFVCVCVFCSLSCLQNLKSMHICYWYELIMLNHVIWANI